MHETQVAQKDKTRSIGKTKEEGVADKKKKGAINA